MIPKARITGNDVSLSLSSNVNIDWLARDLVPLTEYFLRTTHSSLTQPTKVSADPSTDPFRPSRAPPRPKAAVSDFIACRGAQRLTRCKGQVPSPAGAAVEPAGIKVLLVEEIEGCNRIYDG